MPGMPIVKKKSPPVDVILSSPVGDLGFSLSEGELRSIQFLPSTPARNPGLKKQLHSLFADLQAYFVNPRHRFKLALKPQGTDFQKAVWKALQAIPCGKTLTYQDLAVKLKTSPRAIGNACRRNPLPIFIPCHRVVSKSGLGGFCGKKEGKFMQVKKALLAWEQK
jgi:methylated-DNA-[protein]-cysteine S-methyltransferase